MPDISMCANQTCPLAPSCYRHEASGTKPNPYRQAYAAFSWVKVEGKPTCEYYAPAKLP